jgi:hypothetical protein
MASDPKNLTAASPIQDLKQLNPQQLAALLAGSKEIQGPVANAANTIVMQAANDAIIMFTRPRPLLTADGQFSNVAAAETVAVIHMSMATLKDFQWAIGEQVRLWEEGHGEIVTDAMKQRAAAKK